MLQVYASNKWESKNDIFTGPVIFGRDPEPGFDACVLQDPFVSRSQLRVTELPSGKVRLENRSKTNRIILSDGNVLETGSSCEQSLPLRLTIGQTLIDISPAEVSLGGTGVLRTIQQPLVGSALINSPSKVLSSLGDAASSEGLARWFEALQGVQRAPACSPEFYRQTAQAAVDLVGLDCGFVLLRRGENWDVAASCTSKDAEGGSFSKTILRRVVEERRTYFDDLRSDRPSASLQEVSAVVASPIIDERTNEVIGALYGARFRSQTRPSCEIKPLEAQGLQILASIVSMGRTRVDSEAEASRRRSQFEQFFSKDLTSELERDPALLEGREREVTIMFADIRNFSRLSEKIPPREACRLICDIMERLTVRIREHQGVVVDYIGDGLLAMWNAPKEQPDHAFLACKAALAMQAEIPAINETWKSVVDGHIGVGVGLNTGPALVGNTGSLQKFKYGPLGHAVNLGSRVEGATKHMGVPILVTGSTRDKVVGRVGNRRIGKVRVKGIGGAVDLYELIADDAGADIQGRVATYEKALGLYEQANFPETCQVLYPILSGQAGHYDQPSLNLASLAIACLKSPPKNFDPIFELDQK